MPDVVGDAIRAAIHECGVPRAAVSWSVIPDEGSVVVRVDGAAPETVAALEREITSRAPVWLAVYVGNA